jgi:omega-hydroxy-beta-dihydromenaquinone-9 sulfotransferase
MASRKGLRIRETGRGIDKGFMSLFRFARGVTATDGELAICMLWARENQALRPGWTESAPWMGCSLRALLRILATNRFRVDLAYWPECFVDLCFAAGNSCLGAGQRLCLGRKIDRAVLSGDPIFIIGHWRTGTTLLHELLALDPRLRAPTTYECLVPHHFLLTGGWLTRFTSFTLPQTRGPDTMRVIWNSPQEDEFGLCNLGVGSPYATIAFPNHGPQNEAYLELDALPAEEHLRWRAALLAFLKGLTYARPGRLVLKSPTHTFRLPTLTQMFPQARWINMVRNPLEVFSSTVRLWRSLYAAYGYQKPRYEGLEEFVLATFARMHDRLEATRGLVSSGALIDVRYEDLVRAPVQTVRRLYQDLSLGDFEVAEPAIGQYFADRAGYQPNRHDVEPHWKDEIRRRWRPYFERYGYSQESGMMIDGSLNRTRRLGP